MATPTPIWNPRNLARHHQTRLRKDPGCFESLLGIAGQTMTVEQYETRSLDTVTSAWGEYEGEGWEVGKREYAEARSYFVDLDLVVAITDGFRREFVSCFHEHFGYPHGIDPGAVSAGQRQLRYQQHLRQEEQGGLIRKVERVRGF
jgi:hypothetical protein